MSFIRRVDGTVVAGGHVESRGSLESIRYNKSNNVSVEDKKWELKVLASAMTHEDLLYIQWYEDKDLTEYLWGSYEGNCPHLIKNKNFNDEYFSPLRR